MNNPLISEDLELLQRLNSWRYFISLLPNCRCDYLIIEIVTMVLANWKLSIFTCIGHVYNVFSYNKLVKPRASTLSAKSAPTFEELWRCNIMRWHNFSDWLSMFIPYLLHMTLHDDCSKRLPGLRTWLLYIRPLLVGKLFQLHSPHQIWLPHEYCHCCHYYVIISTYFYNIHKL